MVGSTSLEYSEVSTIPTRHNKRFQIGWLRWMPFFGLHHCFMIVLVVGVVFLVLVDVGCTASPGPTGIYLLSLSYTNSTPKPNSLQVNQNLTSVFRTIASTAQLEVRASYRGMCINSNGGGWTCSSSAAKLVESVRDLENGDPLNLISIAADFSEHIVFDGLIYISLALIVITFLLLSTFPGWHTEEDSNGSERQVKPFPSRTVSQVALATMCVACALAFSSVFWQHIVSASTSKMAVDLGYGSVESHIGTVAMVLGWGAVLLFLAVTIGLLIMILSIQVLFQTFR